MMDDSKPRGADGQVRHPRRIYVWITRCTDGNGPKGWWVLNHLGGWGPCFQTAPEAMTFCALRGYRLEAALVMPGQISGKWYDGEGGNLNQAQGWADYVMVRDVAADEEVEEPEPTDAYKEWVKA